MKLDGVTTIKNLEFDIANRRLSVFHIGMSYEIENSLSELKLGSRRVSTEETDQTNFEEDTNQRKLLWTVLI
ncbi:MAG: hypothetical protein ACJAR4_002640, partial [Psychroserpens sp.]